MVNAGAEGKQTKNCNLIDLIKYICAALVVAVHVPPFAHINSGLKFLNYLYR